MDNSESSGSATIRMSRNLILIVAAHTGAICMALTARGIRHCRVVADGYRCANRRPSNQLLHVARSSKGTAAPPWIAKFG